MCFDFEHTSTNTQKRDMSGYHRDYVAREK